MCLIVIEGRCELCCTLCCIVMVLFVCHVRIVRGILGFLAGMGVRGVGIVVDEGLCI